MIKRNLLAYLLFSSITMVNGQTNEFKIGIFGASSTKKRYVNQCELAFDVAIDSNNGYNTSVLNVLSEDGFNIVQTYEPNEWTSENYLKSYLELASLNNLKVEISAGHYYKPFVNGKYGYVGYGTNVFDNCGVNYTECEVPYNKAPGYFRADIDNLISSVYNVSPYKDIIWGYHICEEAAYWHEFHYNSVCEGKEWADPGYFALVEIPPTNVDNALDHFKANTPEEHKVVVMEANHKKTINDNTTDAQGVYYPQQYLQLLNNEDERDVFFEGSYTAFPSSDWYSSAFDYDNMMNNNGYHYLGALKSIEYAKQYSGEVHKIVSLEGTKIDPNYWAHLHSNNAIKNANWLWFQSYASIIHGADGVWFWALNQSLNEGEIDYFDTSLPYRYQKDKFPTTYQNFVSNLSKELRLLVDQELISTDPNTIVYSKKDEVDPNCIVTDAASYIPQTYGSINLSNHRNENYGLRYTIRTNPAGDEVIMIIANPLNIPITATLNFDNVGNKMIRQSYGVDVLFETSTSVTSSTYKTNRDGDIDLASGVIGQQYPIYYNLPGRNLTLDFGPLDVHVLKFKTDPGLGNPNGWERYWTNNGNGKLDGWIINETDEFYPGDFDGDGVDELLCVNTGAVNPWITLLDFENGDWVWRWSNYGNSHFLLDFRDRFIVGNYDDDSKDEILGVDNDGWISMFHFENNDWQYGWSDNGNHAITPYKDNLVPGDFDGDGKDEILGCDLPSGWTTMFHYENGDFQWGWSDYGNTSEAIRSFRNNMISGDFDGDQKDEILGFDSWATMFHFDNNAFVWGWSTGQNNDHIGAWDYPIPVGDQVLAGDVDDYDNKDELMLLQTSTSATDAVSMELNSGQTDWDVNWEDLNNRIHDWPLHETNGYDTKYFLMKIEANQPNFLVAMRNWGCSSTQYNYEFNIYKSLSGNKNFLENDLNEGDAVDYDWSIYPNPSKGIFNVLINDRGLSHIVEVYDQTGRLITTLEGKIGTENEIDLTKHSKGFYFVVLKNSQGTFYKKINKI